MIFHVMRSHPFANNINLPTGTLIRDVVVHQGKLCLVTEEDPNAEWLVSRSFMIHNTDVAFFYDGITVSMTASPEYVGSAVYGNVVQHVFEVHPAPGHTPWPAGSSLYEGNH